MKNTHPRRDVCVYVYAYACTPNMAHRRIHNTGTSGTLAMRCFHVYTRDRFEIPLMIGFSTNVYLFGFNELIL